MSQDTGQRSATPRSEERTNNMRRVAAHIYPADRRNSRTNAPPETITHLAQPLPPTMSQDASALAQNSEFTAFEYIGVIKPDCEECNRFARHLPEERNNNSLAFMIWEEMAEKMLNKTA